jgi:hypothetical protein
MRQFVLNPPAYHAEKFPVNVCSDIRAEMFTGIGPLFAGGQLREVLKQIRG